MIDKVCLDFKNFYLKRKGRPFVECTSCYYSLFFSLKFDEDIVYVKDYYDKPCARCGSNNKWIRFQE